MEKLQEFERYAISLSSDALAQLDDDTLTDVLRSRVFHHAEHQYGFDFTKAAEEMSVPLRTAFVLFSFDAEIQNGGLDQFFFNSTSELAPYVQEALTAVSAHPYAELFAGACAERGINPSDPSTYDAEDSDEDEENNACSFEEFDDAYYALYEVQPLEPMITQYARAHLNEF